MSGNKIVLTWNRSTSLDLYKYQIFRSLDGVFDNNFYDETLDSTYVDTNIPSSGYDNVYYQVVAVDSSGNVSDFSDILQVSLLTTEINDEPVEYKFNLSQNYPNPFNPSTTIKFSIPRTSFVTIKIFNSIGAEVNTLLNKSLHAGNHQVTFSANELPSGVYFYRMTAEDYSKSYKMLLIK
jgi:hypothetical protein